MRNTRGKLAREKKILSKNDIQMIYRNFMRVASKLYGVNATITIFVFVLYCIVFYCIVYVIQHTNDDDTLNGLETLRG